LELGGVLEKTRQQATTLVTDTSVPRQSQILQPLKELRILCRMFNAFEAFGMNSTGLSPYPLDGRIGLQRRKERCRREVVELKTSQRDTREKARVGQQKL
jgi:hypothetical protein